MTDQKGSAAVGLTALAAFFLILYGAQTQVSFKPCTTGMYRVESQWFGFVHKSKYLQFYGDSWHIADGKTWRNYNCNDDEPADIPMHGWDMN